MNWPHSRRAVSGLRLSVGRVGAEFHCARTRRKLIYSQVEQIGLESHWSRRREERSAGPSGCDSIRPASQQCAHLVANIVALELARRA